MSSRRQRTAVAVASNGAAALAGGLVAVFAPLPLVARIPASVLAGTIGYLVGGWLAGALDRVLRRARLAPPGRPVYTLTALPPSEAVDAGGKARALAQLAQSGFRVPAGIVILPRAFDGDRLGAARGEVAEAVRRLGTNHRFAVRSSAVGEDSALTSFAGTYETVLDVATEEVPAAVEQVRRSARSERVAAYAATHGVMDASQVAVIVQRMVVPDLAGVLFTVDPLTADLSTMKGNLVAGLGDGVVSGDTDAAEFTFHRPDGAYSGPDALMPAARRLHADAHDIESLFSGAPQDIEWAVTGSRPWILQARPVTTLQGWNPTTAERNDSLTGSCLWSATNLSEANPEPQTPLTISLVGYQQEHGGPSMRLRGREMAGYIGGRPYANLTVQLSARGPKAAADPRAAYAQIAGLWGELPAAVPIPLLPLTRADWQEEGLRLLGTLFRLRRARSDVPAFLATSRARCATLTAQVAGTRSAAELRDLWTTELFPASLRSFWAVIAVTDDRSDGLEADLRTLVGPECAAGLLGNLSGLAGTLASLGPVTGLQEVAAGRLSRADYLDRFGHRGANEIELSWPRPSEDPGWLDAALAAAPGTAVSTLRADQQAGYDAAVARLRSEHPREARRIERRLRDRAVAAARREAVRSEAVRWTGLARAFALRAAELLGIGDDVFLLTLPELLDALDGDTGPFAHFEVRRQVLARYRSLPPLPGFIVGRFDPFQWAADPDRRSDCAVAGVRVPRETVSTDGRIVGAPGSIGVVEARVRRLDRWEDADQLLPGEVLVTHLTNIGWTTAFPRAAAIVTDLGAPLSHAAIVARELGVPAVVGCGDATDRLATGDLVRVDGARGTVELLAGAKDGFRDTLEHVFDSGAARG